MGVSLRRRAAALADGDEEAAKKRGGELFLSVFHERAERQTDFTNNLPEFDGGMLLRLAKCAGIW